MNRNIALTMLALILASVACNLPQPTPPPTQVIIITATPPPITSTPVVLPSPLPTLPTALPQRTNTPIPTRTPICNLADFISDVTYSDNTQVVVGTPFVKTWRLKNIGTCTWTSGYQLVFDGGDQMSAPLAQSLMSGTVAPGQTVDISVALVAPTTPGTYRGYWLIREPGGTLFGLPDGHFWVQIMAVKPVASLPDWPDVALGATGPDVRALQYLLRVRGQSVTVDGNFGNETRAAVINFQASVGLTQDGIAGPNTWSALIAGIQYAQGSSGEGVRAVQTLLLEKFGYNTISVDGIFSTTTADAVRDFQEAHGLTVNGIVGPDTWQALVAY